MTQFIYADNAATTKLDIDAFEAMKAFLLDEYANASQLYSFSRKPKQALKEARAIIAQCINASPDEIYFTSGGTESDNWAIRGTACSKGKSGVITSQIEHHAVLKPCRALEEKGFNVNYLPITNEGMVTTEALETAMTNETRLVSVMFANNEIGTIEPIKELCETAHGYGALFHTDAVQAIGHIRVDVQELGVDMLSASAHKFNGPKGVGFLYIRKGIQIEPLIKGGAQEAGLRAGTENIAGIVGMAVALKKNCDEMIKNCVHIMQLEESLLEGLRSHGVTFVRNGGNRRLPGLVSLSFPGYDGEAILHRLDLGGICVSTGSACDSKNTQISHVLEALGLDEDIAKGTVRISLGKDNSHDEVLAIVEALKKIVI